MSGQFIVTLLYLTVSVVWLATKGRSLIKRNNGYYLPIIAFGIGSAMLVLGTNYTSGWEAMGLMLWGFIFTAASLIIFLVVFIYEEKNARKG
ncbi:hypothetical protein ACOJQI_11450 [Bacillus salacetis]|uniref:hypothetical protein n=1 Tax=Bacillus salacetis TaxID=2315464 RepID=UPI003BA2E412